MASTSPSLSFEPWARGASDTASLKEILARVNLERGHFRDITEASLQEEIAADGALDLSESDSDEDERPDGEVIAADPPQTREELFKTRGELLDYIQKAEQDVLMALDFVSLLQTKQTLNPAATTISPVLRNSVPMASLGADVWRAAPTDKSRVALDDTLISNVRMISLQRSADDLLASATRLNENVRKETNYWQQVLTVSRRGWRVSKIPRHEHILGVNFGFSGSALEVTQRNLAALVVESDGDMTLERGIGTEPRSVRVLVRQGGVLVGVSGLPSTSDLGETTLEACIRSARDSVYDEELYHELLRESRTLGAQGVSTHGSGISFTIPSSPAGLEQVISYELIPLDESHTIELESIEHSPLAHATVLAARLLLGQAHRRRLQRKANVPQMLTDKAEEKPVFPILRPWMTFLQHRANVDRINSYLATLIFLLHKAGIQAVCDPFAFTLSVAPSESPSTISTLITTTLLQPFRSNASLTITPPAEGNVEPVPLSLHLGVETSPTSEPQPTFSITTYSGRQHKFHSLPDFLSAADDLLASSLVHALCMLAVAKTGGWQCDVRECWLVRKKAHFSAVHEKLYIEVNAHDREKDATISVRGTNRDVFTWRSLGADYEAKDKVFWTIWNEIGEPFR